MGVEEQARKVLARFNQRTAGEFPFQPPPKGAAPPGSPQKRDIPKDHPYDPRALKPLSKALFAASVALGHVLAAHKHFSQVKSPAVSPDGRIGGRGYVMGMDEIRRKLWEASEALSSVSDALHDEINAPHWKPKLALLDENDQEDVSRFVEEAEEVLENPGEEAEEEIEKIDEENDDEEAKGSEVPKGGDAPEEAAKLGDQPGQTKVKEASVKTAAITLRQQLVDAARDADPQMLAEVYQRSYKGGGTDCQTGGPRVDDRGPGAGEGPYGSFNYPEDDPDDGGWNGGVREYDYPSDWDNDLHQAARLWNPWQDDSRLKGGPSMEDYKTIADLLDKGWPPERILNSPAGRKRHLEMSDIEDAKKMRQRGLVAEAQQWAESFMPSDPKTPTEGRDFGIGYGARGEAEENLGDWSPHSGLPGNPWDAVGDTTPAIDVNLNERHGLNSLLPGDGSIPVARTDYYRGDRGNLVNVGAEAELAPDEEELGFTDTSYVFDDLYTDWLPKGQATLDGER